MVSETEGWNLILETIGQLGKLIKLKIMKRGYFDNGVKLLSVLHSFAIQARGYGFDSSGQADRRASELTSF